MSYYWFNREEVMQKAKEKYNNCDGKEKPAEYYRTNKDIFKKESKKKVQRFVRKSKKSKKKKKYLKRRYKEIK